MDVQLDAVEVRVLGALIEKQITTPDYYPLTLNALVNACNQSTNRDPVTTHTEGTVARGVEGLRQKGLAWVVTNSRALKVGNRFAERFKLGAPQVAVMCVLMLRGSQTPGEIRGRTGRMHEFATIEEVEAALEPLTTAEPPFAVKLPRLPGTKEARYAHRLSGAAPDESQETRASEQPLPDAAIPSVLSLRAESHRPEAPSESESVARLEREIESLRREVQELRRELGELRERL